MDLISLFINSFLAENIFLTKFLGLSPLSKEENRVKDTVIIGLIVSLITVLSSILAFGIYFNILIPLKMTYLTNIVYLLLISLLYLLVKYILNKYFINITKDISNDLLLVLLNSATYGVLLINIANEYQFVETILFSLGSSLGLTFILFVLVNLEEYLKCKNVPKAFRGYPILFIVSAIISLIFTRLI